MSKSYLVIHDFNKIGSAVMEFTENSINDLNRLFGQCLMIAEPPVQVVRLGGPNALEVYSEYSPYTYVTAEQELLNMCITGDVPGDSIDIAKIRERKWTEDNRED